jgi:hypothetical protein
MGESWLTKFREPLIREEWNRSSVKREPGKEKVGRLGMADREIGNG